MKTGLICEPCQVSSPWFCWRRWLLRWANWLNYLQWNSEIIYYIASLSSKAGFFLEQTIRSQWSWFSAPIVKLCRCRWFQFSSHPNSCLVPQHNISFLVALGTLGCFSICVVCWCMYFFCKLHGSRAPARLTFAVSVESGLIHSRHEQKSCSIKNEWML